MANILVSGLVNTETSAKTRGFPIQYYPIDYPFFGVKTSVSGVGYNLSRALTTLGDEVSLCSMLGTDLTAELIRAELSRQGIGTENLKVNLAETPSSVVLYDETGRRQVYCDLKNIQETSYDFSPEQVEAADLVIACNINFNRALLQVARAAGKLIATDVHVLSNPDDDYNRDFMAAANILFLSDEGIPGDPGAFLRGLAGRYGNRIIVLGMGSKGAMMYTREDDSLVTRPAFRIGTPVNTIGAGDALFSGFLHYYLKGLSPQEALDRAQLFAAMKIRHSGGAVGFPTETELETVWVERSTGILL